MSYDRRKLDTVIVRLHAGRSDGEILTEEKFGWFAAPSWQHRAGEPLPLATMAEPCGVRAMAAQLLDAARVPWTEIFVGGGVAAVAAAVMAGLGVAALAPRMLPFGAVDVGPKLGLPDLPRLPVLLHSRITNGRPRDALPRFRLPSGARCEASQRSQRRCSQPVPQAEPYGEQFCQAAGFAAAVKCEGWQRERTGLVPEMLFLAAALKI